MNITHTCHFKNVCNRPKYKHLQLFKFVKKYVKLGCNTAYIDFVDF